MSQYVLGGGGSRRLDPTTAGRVTEVTHPPAAILTLWTDVAYAPPTDDRLTPRPFKALMNRPVVYGSGWAAGYVGGEERG